MNKLFNAVNDRFLQLCGMLEHCLCFVLGPLLETLMEQMRSELDNNPPLPGAYTPKKGDLCAAKFSDGEW